ncbi:MAG: universal stress protein [Paracoccaceae bacterium]|nr:universal stress protein [Paracoccaceae bacterium]
MYQNILVPMALDHGISANTLEISRALKAPDGKITAIHVYEAPQGSVRAYLDEDVLQAAYEGARKRLEERVAGLGDVTPVLLHGHTSQTIVDYANDKGIDCIVIGSHKPGLKDFLLGSTAARVVRHAACSVHVLRS